MLKFHNRADRIVPDVPIANEKGDVPIRLPEGHGDDIPVIDRDSAEPTGRSLEVQRGEVEEAPNLVLHLELVCPVPA